MADRNSILTAIVLKLKDMYPQFNVFLWFGDAEIVLVDRTRVVLSLGTEFKYSTVARKYKEDLQMLFSEHFNRPLELILIKKEQKLDYAPLSGGEILYTYGEQSDFESPVHTAPQSSESFQSFESRPTINKAYGYENQSFISQPQSVKKEHQADISHSNPLDFQFQYTFENFIVGSSNQFAHAACFAVAKNPATDYNPLFIYSASGLGKTHLLNAIMSEIKKNNPGCVIIYVKGEEFTNQMIEAIKSGSQVEFRNKYRKADVLLIDDIQFIAGKDSTQEEFFHTFNALYESHKQIIMTSDKPPKDIKTLEDRLKTRFEWGLIADIQPPDYELRIAIMKNKAKLIGMELPDDVLAYIAERLKTNIREIEGAVKRVCARSFLTGEEITLQTAIKAMEAFVTNVESPMVTVERIVERVSKKYGVAVEDIYSRKRTKHIAFARSASVYIIRKITDMSFPEIGKLFDRDHSTIISAHQVIVSEFSKNPLLEIEIQDLIKEITE